MPIYLQFAPRAFEKEQKQDGWSSENKRETGQPSEEKKGAAPSQRNQGFCEMPETTSAQASSVQTFTKGWCTSSFINRFLFLWYNRLSSSASRLFPGWWPRANFTGHMRHWRTTAVNLRWKLFPPLLKYAREREVEQKRWKEGRERAVRK